MKEKEIKKEEQKIYVPVYIINPRRDWIILMVISATIFLGAIFYDYSFYKRVSTGEMYISVNKDELTLEALNVDELKKILQLYKDKSDFTSQFQTMHSIDPSL